MSVTMTKVDGLTMVSVTSDPESVWPPLFKDLCNNPLCCSVSQDLRRVQGTSQSALGATQIMVGVINFYLGNILINNNGSSWLLSEYQYSLWFGALVSKIIFVIYSHKRYVIMLWFSYVCYVCYAEVAKSLQ